jgi:tetratricopeptide (TPR) repeat protein
MALRRGVRWLLSPALLSATVVFLASASPDAAIQTQSGGDSPDAPKQNAPAPLPPVPTAAPALPNPDAPHTVLGEAMLLDRKGDFDRAITKYQQYLQQEPKSPAAYAGLTRCYLKKKDVAQAYNAVQKGLDVADAWPLRVALGEVYFRQGKIPEAETEWVQVINSGHQAARAYMGIARVRWAIQMNKSAKTMIEKAHELDPNDEDIRKLWIGTLPRGERIKYYESYLSDSSNRDPEERGNLERYLSYLKGRAKQTRSPCRLVSNVRSTTTPLVRLLLDPTHLRGYGLSVDLNGTHTNIMLDTGASGIVVKRGTAERAGITKLVESKLWGVGDRGNKGSFVGIAKSIRIGELEFQDCPVQVMEDRSVAGEDGLIGADIFEDFLVEVDFPKEQLKLSELPKRPGQSEQQVALKDEDDDSDDAESSDTTATSTDVSGRKTVTTPAISGPQDRYIAPEMQSYTRVYRFGHDLLVPTRVGDVPGMLFVMDTGAMSNSISPAAARQVTKVHGDSDTIIKGLNGSVKNVFSANKAVLQFGHVRQENQDMTAFDMTRMSEGEGTEISGFLGFVALRWLDIKIDYRDALVDFQLRH